MDEILFEVLRAVLIVLVMIFMRYAVPWIKEHTTLAQQQIIADIVAAAVQYAEQIYKGQAGKGIEKKTVVTEFLKEQLTAKDIALSDLQLDALIESAVYAMNAGEVK